MTSTSDLIAQRLGLKADDPEAVRLAGLAETLLDQALAGAFRTMPDDVRDECLARIARTLKDAKSTPGSGQATVTGAAPAFAPRDPLAAVRTILPSYVVSL